ncbi:Maf family protein [Prosthecomicrobium sp. N25]|uniref:Maf family protein n=1 Tax=Prosthecomicrobium sp. N25 TaxID=3129254 RepID=UPI003077448A
MTRAAAPLLVLASRSPARMKLLGAAGLDFEAIGAGVDERAVETPLLARGAGPGEVALHLAEAKALAVSARMPGRLVLGADQTLGLGAEVLVKAETRAEACRQLGRLQGRTHELHAAVAAAEAGVVVWRHVSVARLTMRPLDPAAVDDYLDAAGEGILGSVGCYHLEGLGIRLFEAIEGDYFTVLGLPMLPLLGWLRGRGLIDAPGESFA